MDWTFWLIVVGVLVIWWMVRSRGRISPDAARRHAGAGALVVDVRSAAEFAGNHVPGAINIPLGELAEELPRRLPDHDAVVLLHCLSGGRSVIGWHRLHRLGYRNVYNLGSFSRAMAILGTGA